MRCRAWTRHGLTVCGSSGGEARCDVSTDHTSDGTAALRAVFRRHSLSDTNRLRPRSERKCTWVEISNFLSQLRCQSVKLFEETGSLRFINPSQLSGFAVEFDCKHIFGVKVPMCKAFFLQVVGELLGKTICVGWKINGLYTLVSL